MANDVNTISVAELNQYDYSKNHNTGARQNVVVQGVMLFKPFDLTTVFIIAFDWLSKNSLHASDI